MSNRLFVLIEHYLKSKHVEPSVNQSLLLNLQSKLLCQIYYIAVGKLYNYYILDYRCIDIASTFIT